MKSFKKLMSFNSHKVKEKRDILSQEASESKQVLEDESKEMQGLREMQNQYEGLYSVSSLVSSRATDFSSAIQELATYFIDTFSSIEDGEMSKVFKIVGRVQFEISKILDLYAAHVAQTITEPTEILLSELRNVQDSKKQHDEKRQLYEQLRMRIVKGRSKNGKGEAFADQQLQVVKDEFDKLSMFVNTRLISLEQGQGRSLITQAARHHTAQMHLFSRGHSSLQAVEPYMRQVSRERNIDRQLSSVMNGINNLDDDSDSRSDDDVSYIEEFDDSDSQSVEQSNRWDSHVDTPGRSSNNQDEEAEVPKNLSKEWSSLLSKLGRTSGEIPQLRDGDTPGSMSKEEQGSVSNLSQGYKSNKLVPLSPHRLPTTIQVTEVLDEPPGLNHSSSAPLRSPPEVSIGITRGYDRFGLTSEAGSLGISNSGSTSADWHCPPDMEQTACDSARSPLKTNHSPVSSSDAAFQPKFPAPTQKLPGPMSLPTAMEKPPVVTFVSPSLSSTPVRFTSSSSDSRRNTRRYSQSGPLTFNGTPWSSQPSYGKLGPSTNESVNSADLHRSGPLGRSPLGRTFGSPRISPTLSPPKMSPPRISELHKLPPPPLNPINKGSARSPPIIAHSEPLPRPRDPLGNSLVHATALPPPPLGAVPRSLSLPLRQKQHRSKPPSIAQVPEDSEEENPAAPYPQPSTEATTTARASGTTQLQSVQKRVGSESHLDQENGLPISDLKFVHYNSARSPSGTPTLSSQHLRQPSLSTRGGKDKTRQLDVHRPESGSHYVATSLKTGGSVNLSRWRSLSTNDKDSYIQTIGKGAGIQKGFSSELVPLNPT